MNYIFSSRRQEITDEQLDNFALNFGDGTPMVGYKFPKTLWSATQFPTTDLSHNITTWLDMIRHGENLGYKSITVLGDFPHAALEALNNLHSSQLERIKVYVRIYKIGGGFVRDTEFLRWARIK